MIDESEETGERRSGKYLTFSLADEIYGLAILKVQEIIGITPITRVPRTPDFVRGVINLRGRVIPIISLRVKFALPSVDDTERTCIIVVQVEGEKNKVTMGVIVDEVSEVLDIASGQIEPAPDLGAGVDTDFIMGIGKTGDEVIMLLDIDRVLSIREIEAVGDIN